MAWKTYLVMYFGTQGPSVSEVVKKVESLGFKAALGPVDFIYDWKDKAPTKDEVLKLADKLTITLKSTGVIFNLDTHN